MHPKSCDVGCHVGSATTSLLRGALELRIRRSSRSCEFPAVLEEVLVWTPCVKQGQAIGQASQGDPGPAKGIECDGSLNPSQNVCQDVGRALLKIQNHEKKSCIPIHINGYVVIWYLR